MIILFKKNATPEEKQQIFAFLENAGIQYKEGGNRYPLMIETSSSEHEIMAEQIEFFPGVDQIFDSENSFKFVNRTNQPEDTTIALDDVLIGSENQIVIAGPCAVESREQMLETAQFLKSEGIRIIRGGAFKPRTSPYSFRGLAEDGLQILNDVRDVTGLLSVTEVLDDADMEMVADYSDIIQIGSRSMQNYRLLRAAGKVKNPVLLKRGMSARLDEFLYSAEYIMSEGNHRVILCERGIRTFVEYCRNTLDLNVVPAIRKLSHLPIIVDPSHGTGRRDLVESMSLAALAAGAHGIMVEVHPSPKDAWSDADQALTPDQFSALIRKVNHFISWREKYADYSTFT